MDFSRDIRLLARVILAAVLSTLLAFTPSRAHEVQPGVMDLEFRDGGAEIFLDWILEAPVAGIDLAGISDTNEAENAGDYDRLRALGPAEMEAAFRSAWPALRDRITIRAGDEPVVPELTVVEVPEVGDTDLSRTSTLTLSLALPDDGAPLVIGWDAAFGPLVVRQRNVDGGYAGYLVGGQLSDPIPRAGDSTQSAAAAFADYTSVGFDHIVPEGLDHILFVLGLFFLSLHIRPLLAQVTAFTAAHTVTLALGALEIVRVPAGIVEPLIAASIVYVGAENILLRRLSPWRPAVVFGFGLLHGLGFASVLQDFGLGADNFVAKLIGFNLGVELGQLAVISAAWLGFGLLFGNHVWYFRRIAAPVSLVIALVALFWVLERTAVIDPDGAWTLFALLTGGGLPVLTVAAAGFGVAAVLTGLVFAFDDSDPTRDICGFATSFVLFLALVAAFTAKDWLFSLVLAGIWILALRLQSLGGEDAYA